VYGQAQQHNTNVIQSFYPLIRQTLHSVFCDPALAGAEPGVPVPLILHTTSYYSKWHH